MLVKMIKTTLGSENGIIVKEFEADQEYITTERLAHVFVDEMKVAVRVEKKFELPPVEDKEPEEPKKKMVEEAPKNKAIDTTPKNKRGLTRNGRKRMLSRG